jgi:hypothetical protein
MLSEPRVVHATGGDRPPAHVTHRAVAAVALVVTAVAIAPCGLVFLWAACVSPPGFYARHADFLHRAYGVAGIAPWGVRAHMGELTCGRFIAPVHGVSEDDLRHTLGTPGASSPVNPRGDIPAVPGAVRQWTYRSGAAVAVFDIDAQGEVLAARTYDVAYFQ